MTDSNATTPSDSPSLLEELRQQQRDLLKLIGPAGVVTLIGFAIAFFFVEPAPPRKVVIATGAAQGDYYAAAQKYVQLFQRNGIDLEVKETGGSVDNYALLRSDDEINLAIVQGGAAPSDLQESDLEAIASLYLEPVWVFHRRTMTVNFLSDFTDAKIAVGREGSGTRALAKLLLNENGVTDQQTAKFLPIGGREAVDSLLREDVDAIFLVLSPNSPLIRELMQSDQVQLFNFTRAGAYARRHQFLESVVLEPGVIDLTNNLPSEPIHLVAPYANLVATSEFHDAFIPLLLEAATSAHESGGLLVDAGTLPSTAGAEFTTNPVARQYFKHGPSFFQRHLSFWAASLIDRGKIMLIPLIALLIPVAKLAPPVYRWRIRSRIYRWYAILRGIDQRLREGDDVELARFDEQLDEMEHELTAMNVPLSYMEEFYHLRLHIDLVKRRLSEKHLASDSKGQAISEDTQRALLVDQPDVE